MDNFCKWLKKHATKINNYEKKKIKQKKIAVFAKKCLTTMKNIIK